MSQKMEKKKIWHAIRRCSVSTFMLCMVILLIKIAPNYEINHLSDRTNLIINNNNITTSLKTDVVIESDVVYLSFDDVKNFFDEYLTIEGSKIITTSNTKTSAIQIDGGKVYENGSYTSMDYKILKKDDKYYIPINKFEKIYNIEVNYNEEKNIVTIDSLSRKAVTALASKDLNIKYRPSTYSKTLDKVKRGETLTVIQNEKESSWIKVRSPKGVIGYIKRSNIIDEKVIRENLERDKIEGKVSIVWDYYNQYTAAPTRSDTIKGVNVVAPSFFELRSDGSLAVNVGTSGTNYINWAKQNNIEVWPVLSNSMLNNINAVSQILSTFETRANLIDNIINELVKIDVQGIHVDFENMNKSDKDNYSRFIIELAPRLREIGMTLSVLLTEPDGSDTWSLCYDRNVIGKVADYVVFMGYDQHTASSQTAGTIAGADWVELNINKFLGQEDVSKDKIILAMPFYTRLWIEENGKLTNKVVNMKDVKIPANATKVWDDNLKQNYIEYKVGNAVYKMWIEDKDSISCKLDLVNKYDLAGAGFWEKDRENEEVWDIVEQKLK